MAVNDQLTDIDASTQWPFGSLLQDDEGVFEIVDFTNASPWELCVWACAVPSVWRANR